MTVESRRVTLERPNHHVCLQDAAIGHGTAGFDGRDRCLLRDRSAQALHRLTKASHKPSRVERSRVSEEQAAHHVGGVEEGPGLVGPKQAEVVVVEAECTLMVLDLVGLALELSCVASKADRAALGEMTVDAFSLGHPSHFIDRIEKFAKEATG